MMIYKIIMVGIGGFTGSICRFLSYELILRYFPLLSSEFYLATLIVNIVGCFLIGLLAGISNIQNIFSPYIRLLLFVGFLGGFTTFSTFGYELFTMIKSQEIFNAFLHTGIHIIFGLIAVAVGFYLSITLAPFFLGIKG